MIRLGDTLYMYTRRSLSTVRRRQKRQMRFRRNPSKSSFNLVRQNVLSMISIKVQLTPSWPSFASHPEPPSFCFFAFSPGYAHAVLGLSTRTDTDFERCSLFFSPGDSFQNAFSVARTPLLPSCYRIRLSTNSEHSILPPRPSHLACIFTILIQVRI